MKNITVQQPLVYPITTAVAAIVAPTAIPAGTILQHVKQNPACLVPPAPLPWVVDPDNEIGTMALTDPAPFDFILPGLMRGGVAMMIAPGGTGKSYWALQAALSVATGIDINGFHRMNHTIKKGKVAYLSFEDGKEVIHARVRNVYKHFTTLDNQEAITNMKDFKLKPMNKGDIDFMSHHLSESHLEITKTFEGYDLVIVDTLSQAHDGEENSNREMAILVGNLQRIARNANCSIVVLHHASKAAILNGLGTTAEAARGGGVLIGNIRVAYYLSTMNKDEAETLKIIEADDHVKFGTSKVNHIAGLKDFWYSRGKNGVLIPNQSLDMSFMQKVKQFIKPKKKFADVIDAKLAGETTL